MVHLGGQHGERNVVPAVREQHPVPLLLDTVRGDALGAEHLHDRVVRLGPPHDIL